MNTEKLWWKLAKRWVRSHLLDNSPSGRFLCSHHSGKGRWAGRDPRLVSLLGLATEHHHHLSGSQVTDTNHRTYIAFLPPSPGQQLRQQTMMILRVKTVKSCNQGTSPSDGVLEKGQVASSSEISEGLILLFAFCGWWQGSIGLTWATNPNDYQSEDSQVL